MFKKLFLLITISGISFCVNAQNLEGVNARIDAMGGCGVASDIGWTIGKPSSLYAFGDQVQLSALIVPIEGVGESYGSIIAIKSIGEQFYIGLTLNDRRPMGGFFYTQATDWAGFTELFGYMTQIGLYFPIYPQLNFNWRPNDNVSIGLGGFFEHSKHDAEHTPYLTHNVENTSGDTVDYLMQYDSTTVKKYVGIGINLDARIWFGESGFKINPEFRIFIPNLDGEVKTTSIDTYKSSGNKVTQESSLVDKTYEAKTTDLANNIYLRAGTKVSGTFGNTFWILGLWYKTERFEFERIMTTDSAVVSYTSTTVLNNSVAEKSFQYKKNFYDWWLGCQPLFSDNLIFNTEYSGGVYVYEKSPPSYLAEDSTFIRIKHKIRLGAEMSCKGFWIFKEVLPRLGCTYYFNRDIWKYNNSSGEVDSTSEFINWPYSSNNELDLSDDGLGGKITAGIGLRGKRGSFDLSLDILNWVSSGITGPGAAMATFGLYFGRKERE